MAEKLYERKLQIKTTGLREWRDASTSFNRYEATPYRALEALCKHYTFQQGDQLVDFGSGRGRVAFYFHHRFHIPVTGVEVNEQTLDEAFRNKRSYRLHASDIKAPIHFEFGYAEQYDIQKEDNCFYFFNPFSADIFKKVIANIVRSVEKEKRRVDVILYYPLTSFTHHMERGTPFTLLNKIQVPKTNDRRESFAIYRWEP